MEEVQGGRGQVVGGNLTLRNAALHLQSALQKRRRGEPVPTTRLCPQFAHVEVVKEEPPCLLGRCGGDCSIVGERVGSVLLCGPTAASRRISRTDMVRGIIRSDGGGVDSKDHLITRARGLEGSLQEDDVGAQARNG